MAEVVPDVGEEGALRARPRGDLERFFERQMARVGLVAQRVDDEHGNSGDFGDDLRRHMMAVAEVSRQLATAPREDVAVDKYLSVRDLGGRKPDVAHGEGRRDFARIGPDVISVCVLSVECVVKHASQPAHGMRRRVDRHGTVGQLAKAAQVVKPGNVVGVGVGKNGGIKPFQPVAQGLRAEIGCGVDEQQGCAGFDKNRRAQALVALVGGPAHRAVAGDKGDPLGRARAKEGDRKFGHDGKGHLGIR
ncbi:MAG: hypothetical protein RIQ71_2293 [Verrucomicrobiota bacterium]